MESIQKCFIIFLLIFPQLISSQVVFIENGPIEGYQVMSRKGSIFHSFRNIPYAEAPIGNLRFQPPVKKSNWTEIKNAKNHGFMCMQPSRNRETFPMDEDCLHLNVFTKNLGNVNLKPVLVYIHGGEFQFGTSFNHGPEYFMDRDLVLVTINYRLGAFGFLASGTSKAMGNMGLKDQVMALQWVQDNIKIFGGDPQQVTISGLSAGGFSVTSHLASEMSKGLFHKVIAMSGTITWMSRMNSDYKEIVEHLARESKCPSTQDAVECLQGVDAKELVEINVVPATPCGTPVAMYWNPVVEIDFGQERFFTKNPLDVYKDSPSRFEGIPVMIGITEDEAIYTVPWLLSDPQFMTKMKNDFNRLLYECFYLAEVPKDTSFFKRMYFAFDEIDHRSFEGLGKLGSDGNLGYGTHRLVHLLSNYTDVYYYKFSYSGQNSVFNYPRSSPYGVTHADDIQYVFNTWYLGQQINEFHPDAIMVERMTRLWEQFVWRGNPNNSTDEYLRNVIWPKHDYENEYYLDIGTHLIEKHGLFLERFAAWDRLSSSTNKIKQLSFLSILFTSILLKLFAM